MNYLSTFFANFHFIRPWWFLALIALFFALWLLKKYRFNQSPWNKFIPEHLSQLLVEGSNANNKTAKTGFFSEQANLLKPFIIGLLAITALAGPTWQKLPQPVYQTERGSVLIMDMSYSMYATDIKPNRLTRARFKAVDLLNTINEGDIGLIAYAGDAFVISPLTQDIKNIELLLPSLSPEIMPELGANVFAALSLAHEMLTNAGHLHGDIYWFTDDVDNSEITDIYDWSAEFGHRLNILGIGSQDGAPITLPSGELLKDEQGAIVVPKLPMSKLSGLASRGNGHYRTISHNDNDISALTSNEKVLSQTKEQQESQQQGDQWQEQGPWLLVVILPLLLSYFRRGSAILALSSLALPLATLLSFTLTSPDAFAAEQKQSTPNQVLPTEQEQQSKQASPQVSGLQQTWQNLWKTQDQQAQERYNQQDYQGAAQQFKNSQWQGSAHYKSGNYQKALDDFKQGEQANSASSLYNQGNALAQLQQYDQAIEAYENALEKNPDLQDAKDNLEKIKQMQKQQEQQQQNQESQENQSNDNNENQEQQQNSQDQQSQDQQSKDKNSQQNQQPDNSEQKNGTDKESQENQQESSEKENNQQSEQDKKEKEAKEHEAQKAEQQGKQDENKTAAQIAAEQQAKETEQKHKQLLNKVTDDPYLLLRNKMQLEYQKRKQQGASQGAKKKW